MAWRKTRRHDEKIGIPENLVQLMGSVRSMGLFVFTCADANPPCPMERIATMNWYSALDASMQTFMPVYPFKDVSLIAPGQLSRINFVNPLIPMLVQ